MGLLLRRTWDRVRTVPGLGRDLTALLVVVALGISSAVYMLSHYGVHAPWQQRFEFSAYFADAHGVTPDNHQEVQIAGVPVGTIVGAKPAANGTAELTMSLDPGVKVYRNAQLVLDTKNPINEMYVELNPGGPPADELSEHGVLPVTQTKRPVQSYEVLDKLDTNTRSALSYLLDASNTALADAPADLPADLRVLNQNATDFRPVFDALATRRERIASLVTDLSQISAAVGDDDTRLTSLVDGLQQTLGALSDRNSDLSATLGDLPGFTDQLNGAMQGVGALTGQLNPTLTDLHNAATALPPALKQFGSTADQLGQTVRLAGPVIDQARPVVSGLRPIVGDLNSSLTDLKPITARLGDVTGKAVPWMNDLAAFFYNDASLLSNYDANAALARGHLAIDPSNPTGIGAPNGGQK
ncbi:MCE family protein [Amycolatopsis sp. K13G38]|uniref:MCE family protein n=1 Tax=Amycolatopsis acididurans TaxID=2724524 RepID=A0ABX1J0B1_9PSEU|nr:MlaD family protein [Amycolatopsis acididurans]NKQ53218.1 MCE family protein [Amycolatopsis acididurans]